MRPISTFPRVTAVLVAVAVASIVAASASARSTAKPTLVATPALSGQVTNPFVGDKLTTSNGQWSGSPTTYTYVWQRCDAAGDRQNCVPITGATAQSYTLVTADVNHTVNAVVTATNADGSASKDTKATGVVSPPKVTQP